MAEKVKEHFQIGCEYFDQATLLGRKKGTCDNTNRINV